MGNLARLAYPTHAAAVIHIVFLALLGFTVDVIPVLTLRCYTLCILAGLSFGILQITFHAMLTAMVSTVGFACSRINVICILAFGCHAAAILAVLFHSILYIAFIIMGTAVGRTVRLALTLVNMLAGLTMRLSAHPLGTHRILAAHLTGFARCAAGIVVGSSLDTASILQTIAFAAFARHAFTFDTIAFSPAQTLRAVIVSPAAVFERVRFAVRAIGVDVLTSRATGQGFAFISIEFVTGYTR